jgi:hypothetical protein
MKLLIRCKLTFSSRKMIISVLSSLIQYELHVVEFRNLIDKQDNFKIEEDVMS